MSGFGPCGRKFIPNNFTQRPFHSFDRGNGGQCGGFSRGYGYQGHITYQDPATGDNSSSPIHFGSYNLGPSIAVAFTCYNWMNDASKLNQIPLALVLSSPKVVEDPS